MADCHDLFQEFYEKIKLTKSKKQNLREARTALRNKIRKYFIEVKKEKAPLFHGQGSFYMNIINNPLPPKDYDIDDGIYLQNLDKDKSKWPSTETVHKWIIDAVDGHTDKKPEDKSKCVRVLYGKTDYHVDLPIYGMSGGVAYLADKENGWSQSDPKSFIEWFDSKVDIFGDQLIRLICYFKAWDDYKKGISMSGVAFTVCTSENISQMVRDDQSLVKTAKQMKIHIENLKEIRKPVIPFENLIGDWSMKERNDFIEKLNYLIKKGDEAISEDDKEKASHLWRDVFGDRFPIYKSKEKATVLYSTSLNPAKLWA